MSKIEVKHLKQHKMPSHTYTIAMISIKLCMLSGLVQGMCTNIFFLPHPKVGWGISKFQKTQFGHFQAAEKDSDLTYPRIYGVSKFNGDITLKVKSQGHT